MSDIVDPEQAESSENEAKHHARGLFSSIRKLLHDRLSLKDLSDPEQTIVGIKKDATHGCWSQMPETIFPECHSRIPMQEWESVC